MSRAIIDVAAAVAVAVVALAGLFRDVADDRAGHTADSSADCGATDVAGDGAADDGAGISADAGALFVCVQLATDKPINASDNAFFIWFSNLDAKAFLSAVRSPAGSWTVRSRPVYLVRLEDNYVCESVRYPARPLDNKRCH